jgi:hypothetical protein
MAATPVLPGMRDAAVEEPLARPGSGALKLPDAAEPPRLFDAARDTAALPDRPVECEEPDSPELQLVGVRAELARQQVAAAESAARCVELERAVARERRAAEHEIEYTTSNLVRAHAIAVADRDRAVAQHEEAVEAREAAVRTRQRMETQRDEAIARSEAAEARRDEATAQRNDARRERDELRAAYRALQKQLKTTAPPAGSKRPAPQPAADQPPGPAAGPTPRGEAGVAVPLAETVAPAPPIPVGPLGRGAQRDADHGLTSADRWGIRLLVTTGGLCFAALLVFLIKALFGL